MKTVLVFQDAKDYEMTPSHQLDYHQLKQYSYEWGQKTLLGPQKFERRTRKPPTEQKCLTCLDRERRKSKKLREMKFLNESVMQGSPIRGQWSMTGSRGSHIHQGFHTHASMRFRSITQLRDGSALSSRGDTCIGSHRVRLINIYGDNVQYPQETHQHFFLVDTNHDFQTAV